MLCFTDLHIKPLRASRNVTEGDSLVLDCEAEGEPKITYRRWTHRGEFIANRELTGDITSTNINRLRINSVSHKDTGSYTCHVHNQIYTKSATFFVMVLCK